MGLSYKLRVHQGDRMRPIIGMFAMMLTSDVFLVVFRSDLSCPVAEFSP